ncbi:hypothetical protein OH76DRAFT_559099 [Lentinus brumalis]|uniref:Uncharacterized protein n=1 Tax=Lentinus brumalis TaxID=2498619 RepID=A0A371D9F5_9APHY|nr:hypothetical protein OH76DRAFT_559099 [Polyporus brumalis]
MKLGPRPRSEQVMRRTAIDQWHPVAPWIRPVRRSGRREELAHHSIASQVLSSPRPPHRPPHAHDPILNSAIAEVPHKRVVLVLVELLDAAYGKGKHDSSIWRRAMENAQKERDFSDSTASRMALSGLRIALESVGAEEYERGQTGWPSGFAHGVQAYEPAVPTLPSIGYRAEVAADVPGGLRLRVSNGKLSLFHARSLLIAIHCSDSKSPANYVGIARSLRGRRLSHSPKRAAELLDWFVPLVGVCDFSMAEHQGYANVMQDVFSRIGKPRRGARESSRRRSSAAALQLRASLFLSPPSLELFRQRHLPISGDKYGRRVEEQRTH